MYIVTAQNYHLIGLIYNNVRIYTCKPVIIITPITTTDLLTLLHIPKHNTRHRLLKSICAFSEQHIHIYLTDYSVVQMKLNQASIIVTAAVTVGDDERHPDIGTMIHQDHQDFSDFGGRKFVTQLLGNKCKIEWLIIM